jgi:haloacid dehalogenase-like hydrolase
MTSDTAACQYDVSPDAALAAVRTHEGPLLVDLDETLYLRNSTEDFIDCARPGLLALLFLRLLEVLKPWRLTGGADTRDNWRVGAIATLFPWTRWLWRTKVTFFAEHYVNRELKAAVKARAEPIIVLTVGFKPIVAPLLTAMGFADAKVIAARVRSVADRRNGKMSMAVRELGADTVSSALFVTDSVNDLLVLQNCAQPLRTIWPRARYRQALSDVYLPGEYISRVKRPGEHYILRGVVQEDFAFWLLSSIGLALNPLTHLVGLLLLLLSFWAIYERGYVDNDLAASRYESDPSLSAAFGRVRVATPALQPWICALVAGAVAVATLHPEKVGFVLYFGRWTALLISTYACFLFYNRLDKPTRVWLYPILQLARSAAFAVVVPIEPAGVAALGAHVLSRWTSYQVYRMSSAGSAWPNVRPELARLISFILLSSIMICSFGSSVMLTWSALALLLYNVFRARRDTYAVFKCARRIDKSSRSVDVVQT